MTNTDHSRHVSRETEGSEYRGSPRELANQSRDALKAVLSSPPLSMSSRFSNYNGVQHVCSDMSEENQMCLSVPLTLICSLSFPLPQSNPFFSFSTSLCSVHPSPACLNCLPLPSPFLSLFLSLFSLVNREGPAECVRRYTYTPPSHTKKNTRSVSLSLLLTDRTPQVLASYPWVQSSVLVALKVKEDNKARNDTTEVTLFAWSPGKFWLWQTW